jgi:hypothetical protein
MQNFSFLRLKNNQKKKEYQQLIDLEINKEQSGSI